MSLARPVTVSDQAEELDDPYIQTVSTEDFVKAVEQASQEEEE